jgi:hypothetical protein
VWILGVSAGMGAAQAGRIVLEISRKTPPAPLGWPVIESQIASSLIQEGCFELPISKLG